MRAVVYSGPRDVAVTDVPERPVGTGQVRLRVGFNGVCGTDLHEFYAGPIFVPIEPHPLTGCHLPVVLGHEFSGTVIEVGEGVTSLAEGDRVTVEPIYSFGECTACRSGRYNVCAKVGFAGVTGSPCEDRRALDAHAVLHLPGRAHRVERRDDRVGALGHRAGKALVGEVADVLGAALTAVDTG